MDTMQAFGVAMSTALSETLALIAVMLPKGIAALAIVLAGWLLARVLRSFTQRSFSALDAMLQRVSKSASLEYKRVRNPTILIATNLIFWIVILASVALAGQVLGLTILGRWLDAIVAFVPALVTGLFIIFGGIILGGAVYRLLRPASAKSHAEQTAMLARGAQIVVVISASLVGVATFGIDVTLLANVVTVTFAAAIGSFALAAALGMPRHISNLIGAEYRKFKRPTVSCSGGHRGRVRAGAAQRRA